jgi:hypothetical protein
VNIYILELILINNAHSRRHVTSYRPVDQRSNSVAQNFQEFMKNSQLFCQSMFASIGARVIVVCGEQELSTFVDTFEVLACR